MFHKSIIVGFIYIYIFFVHLSLLEIFLLVVVYIENVAGRRKLGQCVLFLSGLGWKFLPCTSSVRSHTWRGSRSDMAIEL